jgi:hypothetical protein
MSRRPYFDFTSAAAASTEPSEVTSSSMGKTVPMVLGRESRVEQAALPEERERDPSRMWYVEPDGVLCERRFKAVSYPRPRLAPSQG